MLRRAFHSTLLALPGVLRAQSTAREKRTHRNLFNGDCCVYFYNPEIWQPEGLPYSVKAIHRFIDNLVANGVDTFVINPSVHVAYYPSQTLPTMLDGYRRGNRDFFRSSVVASGTPPELIEKSLARLTDFYDLYLDLIEAEVDWFRETVEYSKRKGLAVWSSQRMNDTHNGGDPDHAFDSGPFYRQARFRFEGRTLPLTGAVPPHFIGLNYAFAEVREYKLSMLKEQIAYGVEGVELDWLRDPLCMPPPASNEDLSAMTSFMRQVKRIAHRGSNSLPVGLRIPANLPYLRNIGLDVKRWAQEALIDFVSLGSYWQCTWDSPIDQLRNELGDRIAIYGVIEGAANLLKCRAPRSVQGSLEQAKLQQLGDKIAAAPSLASDKESFRYAAASPEILLGNAASKWALGASGVETFNFYVADQVRIPGVHSQYGALAGLTNLDEVRGRPKQYCVATVPASGFYAWETVEPVPFQLMPCSRRELRLSMCSEPQGTMRLVVQLVIPADATVSRIGISFNNNWPNFTHRTSRNLLFPVGSFTEHSFQNKALTFDLDADCIHDGWNQIVVMNCEARAAVEVRSVEIGVLKR